MRNHDPLPEVPLSPAFEHNALQIGYGFFRDWSGSGRLGKLLLLCRAMASPRQFATPSRDLETPGIPLSQSQGHSFRVKIGRSILRAQNSVWGRLMLPVRLFKLGVQYSKVRRQRRRFQKVDIGLQNDPLGGLMLDSQYRNLIKDRQSYLTKLQNSIKMLGPNDTYPEAPHLRLLYVNGMPYSTSPSGYNLRTQQICEGLGRKGIAVHTVYVGFNTSLLTQEIEAESLLLGTVFINPQTGGKGELAPLIEGAIDQIVHATKAAGSTYIAAGSNWLNGYCALRAARTLGLPFFYDARGLWHYTRSYLEPDYKSCWAFAFQHDMEFAIMRAADQVFVISDPLAIIAMNSGIAAQRLSVIPNMVSASEHLEDQPSDWRALHSIDQDATLLAYAGSVTAYERLDVVFEALKLQADQTSCDQPLHLAIAGKGSHIEALRQLQDRLGIGDQITWLGQLDRQGTQALILAADLMVYPRATHDTFQIIPPIKPLEPMSLGTPCIMSDITPHRTLAGEADNPDRRRAIIVTSQSPQAWREACLDLQANSKNYQDMSQRAARWVRKNRTPDECLQKWVETLEKYATGI